MSRFGEPWKRKEACTCPAIVTEDGTPILEVYSVGTDEVHLDRAIEAVNALSGLDPAKLADFLSQVEALRRSWIIAFQVIHDSNLQREYHSRCERASIKAFPLSDFVNACAAFHGSAALADLEK